MMKDSKIESLKKRTSIDTACSIIIAIGALLIAVTEFVKYGKTNGAYPEHISNGIYAVVGFGITIILCFILMGVRKHEKPFSKHIIGGLRILAVWTMFGAFLPDVLTYIVTDIFTSGNNSITCDITVLLSAKNIIIAMLGVVIGITSEIFVYGYELQDDMDSIA